MRYICFNSCIGLSQFPRKVVLNQEMSYSVNAYVHACREQPFTAFTYANYLYNLMFANFDFGICGY